MESKKDCDQIEDDSGDLGKAERVERHKKKLLKQQEEQQAEVKA